jgi:mono/diheme cytochrome c family protein
MRSVLACAGMLLASCRQDMHDQPRFEPMEASTFFSDGRSQRPQVPGTVARGELFLDKHLETGRVDGRLATTFPFAIDAAALADGRRLYDIHCAVCHDRAGYGEGMVVKRGMKQPPSFHVQRLVESPPGYFFDVTTNGFGAMFGYAESVSVRGRWEIAAYVRALQLSQNARIDDVPFTDRAALEGAR